jgi:hypothetical protein
MKRTLLILALAACSPQEVADKAIARAAEAVILPVVDDTLTQGEAEGVTRCMVDNAAPDELQSLARDVGTVAGTSTLATIISIATRPATTACIAAKGLPQPGFES